MIELKLSIIKMRHELVSSQGYLDGDIPLNGKYNQYSWEALY